MPELPEVEILKKYLELTSLNQPIKEVTVKDNTILENISPSMLRNKLYLKSFLYSQRYGKYLFTKVNKKSWLVIHFGMTGDLKYFRSIENDPIHDRLLIDFKNGFHLAFNCQRKFGRVAISAGVKNFVKRKQLGKDALEVSFPDFKNMVKKRKGSLKSILMNQHVIAGIGNLYSDEILFQTKVHPKTKTYKLSCKRIEELFRNMKRVLNIAIKNKTNSIKLPRNFLLPLRFRDANCPSCGSNLQTEKFSGRTAYFCRKCQKLL
jgi:formamidopyrimidine-DNA glycosylase